MNTKALAAVAAIVVIGVAVYFVTANKGNDSTQDAQQQSTGQQQGNADTSGQSTQQPTNGTVSSSLRELTAQGTRKCTYSDANSSGTVYTADGKARMDISGTYNGVTTASHAIIDGETYYGWVDGQPSGFKFSTAITGAGSAGSNQNVDVNKKIDYSCGSWSADASMFVVPANVTFTDLSAYGM